MDPLKIGDLTVKVPIIQGGMGVCISLSGLASTVANHGGIGVISAIGIGLLEPDCLSNYYEASNRALRKEIRKARSLTSGILGVNIMLAAANYDALLKIAVEEGTDAVFLSAGLPLKMPGDIINRGFKNIHTKFIPKVSSSRAVKLIFNYWTKKYNYIPDAVVVEGPLSGGHLAYKKEDLSGNENTLYSMITDTMKIIEFYEHKFQKNIPIIAAGGIYSGKDIHRVFNLGAQGVKLGTRFVTTHECDAHEEYKNAYLKCKKDDIILIDSPVGLPARVIKNKFVEQILNGDKIPFKCPWKCLKTCDYKMVNFCIAQTLMNAALGNMDKGFAFAGTNTYKATRIQSVKEVFLELINEYEQETLKADCN